MKIIFATGNQDKMREIREIMAGSSYEICSMKEAGIDLNIEENGSTFEENAMIKAEAVAALAPDAIILADDSGLEVDAMDGAPGIYSARFMGRDSSYQVKNQYILDQLAGLPQEKRTARFVCAIGAVFPDGEKIVIRKNMEGWIGEKMAGENGFGYDPIFWPKSYDISSAELSAEEKNRISHRGKALRAMREKLVEYARAHRQ